MNAVTEPKNLPADVAAPSPAAIANASMSPGGMIGALVPQTLDDTFRLAKALAAAGDMVPKHFQQKPESVMAAILRGMEVGLAPMQALSNIAVINGRASIWGDALPALLQRAGHTLDCFIEGEGDKRRAVATVTRGDTGKEFVRTFSVDEAKKAGLWGKQGPWQSYPDRMLQMRARSFAARDGAADALMGLQVAEEVSDYAPPRDVTPREGGFAAKAAAARLPEPKAVTGEIVSDADQSAQGIDYAALDVSSAFPGSDAWEQGAMAAEDGAPISACPYDTEAEAIDWCGAWKEAHAKGGA